MAVGALLLVALTIIGLRYLPARLPVVWERNGAVVAGSAAGGYLLKTGDAYSIVGPSGEERESGEVSRPPGLSPGEEVYGSLSSGPVLAAGPALGLKFGETWVLRAVASGGQTLWEQELPGPPVLLAQEGNRLWAGIIDFSSGGTPVVVSMNATTGEALWARDLQAGLWRAIGPVNGGVAAVLDSGVSVVTAGGSLSWTFAPDRPIIAAAVVEDVVVFSSGGILDGISGYLFPYAITAVIAPGKPLWTARVNQTPLSIVSWSGSGALQGQAAVALGETHVIGFSLRDGERLFGVRTGSRPVRLEGDLLLIEDRRGVRLVRFEPSPGTRAGNP